MPYSWNICTPTPSLAESALKYQGLAGHVLDRHEGAGDAGDAQRRRIQEAAEGGSLLATAPKIEPPIFETACPIPAPIFSKPPPAAKRFVSAASDAITPAPSRQATAEALNGAGQRKFQAANFTHQTFDRKMGGRRDRALIFCPRSFCLLLPVLEHGGDALENLLQLPGRLSGEGSSW